jgi:NAD(P)H-dependent FMN reductase
MSKKVIAFIGSYRKGGISDQAVDAVLRKAGQGGAETKKYYLTDIPMKFCNNCRICTNDDPAKARGRCVINDDMEKLLTEIDGADGIILASPVNDGTVTAVMKRFLERLTVYVYWPWGQHAPKFRTGSKSKKAIIITSSACPAIIGRFLMPNARQVLKSMAGSIGAGEIKSLYFGMASQEEKPRLNDRQLAAARRAAEILI